MKEKSQAEQREGAPVEAELREGALVEAEQREGALVEGVLLQAELRESEQREAEGSSLDVQVLALSCSCAFPSRDELGGIQAPHNPDQTSPRCLCWKGEGQGTSRPPTPVWRLR